MRRSPGQSNNRTRRQRRKGAGIALTTKDRRAAMDAYLATYRETANIMLSCKAANVARSTIFHWREHDWDDFGKRCNVAYEDANDRIDAEIHRRGISGVDEPVYYKGEVVGHIRQYSDQLLLALAKARMPEKYGDKMQVTLDARAREIAIGLGLDPDAVEARAREIAASW